MRIIPRKIKVKTEFIKGVTLTDVIFAFIGVGVAVALFTANFPYHVWVGVGWLIVAFSLFLPVADGIRFYYTLGYLFRFFAQKKKYSKARIINLDAFLKGEEYLEEDEYVEAVIDDF